MPVASSPPARSSASASSFDGSGRHSAPRGGIRFASEAYVEIRYQGPYPTTYGGCTYTDTPLIETCIYAKPDVTVTITAKPAKGGGYIIHGST